MHSLLPVRKNACWLVTAYFGPIPVNLYNLMNILINHQPYLTIYMDNLCNNTDFLNN